MLSMILGRPAQYIGSQPTDPFAVKLLFSRKLANCRHAAKHPRRPPDEASDIMGNENTIPG